MGHARAFQIASSTLAALALVACGGSNAAGAAPPPSPAASASPALSATAAPDADAEKRASLTRARANEIGAAAVSLRRLRGGACPTTKDVTDKYAFAPNTELDASGAPFVIACGDADVRVLTSAGEIASAQSYEVHAATPPSDSPATDATATASSPVSSADRVVAMMRPRFKNCYQHALNSDPTISGEIHGTLTVTADGTVKKVSLDKKTTTITDQGLLGCISAAIKSIPQDPSPDGKERQVSF